jgi:superfamily I DNA and/or RNA helicase
MNARIAELLPPELKGVRVDTPERWQGLERELMIMVHPLSGVVDPSSFDLETGRLCVMASRHRGGLVVVSRDHVGESLEEVTPSADQAVGQPDVNGRGHARHLGFWNGIEEAGRFVEF